MPVSITDLAFYQSQRLNDAPDGGGFMTGNLVLDGELNNLFSDISQLNRTAGFTALRLIYGGLFSADQETLFGAGLFVSNPANDPNVSTLLFAGVVGEERRQVRTRIEQYLSPGVHTPWRLFQDHVAGVGVLTLWGTADSPDFNLGETLILTHSSTVEAVRIKSIQARTAQTFGDAQGTFQRDVYTLVLTRPLQNALSGENASRITTNDPVTLVQQTTVSDGARYYGVKAITSPIQAGDIAIQVDSPLAPLVPATTAETAITDQRPTLSKVTFAAVGAPGALNQQANNVPYSAGQVFSLFVGGPLLPNSLQLSGTFSGSDDGTGLVQLDQPESTATVNYETGEVQITANTGGSASVSMVATPAAAIVQGNQSGRIAVTEQSRAQTYNFTLAPIPSPGSVTVTFRAFDHWVTLRDQGNGSISGQAGEGAGTVNYATGTVSVTLGELPDVDSQILYSWGTGIAVEDARNRISADDPEIQITLQNPNTTPDTVSISYLSGGAIIVLGDDGNGAIQTTDMTTIGAINYPNSTLAFRPVDWPDVGSAITIHYDTGAPIQESFTPTVGTGATGPVNLTLSQVPIAPHSLRLLWSVEYRNNGITRAKAISVVDDGAGGLIYATDGALNGQTVQAGVVNYNTGEVSFPTTALVSIHIPVIVDELSTDADGNTIITPVTVGFNEIQESWVFSTGGAITAFYKPTSVVDSQQQETVEAPPVVIDLAPNTTQDLAQGSVVFSLNGRTYRDRNGALVYDVSPTTNAGILAGTVNYATRQAIITDWASGNNQIAPIGLGITASASPVAKIHHRTDSAPIKQNSYSIRATEYETGVLLTGNADVNGQISGNRVRGHIDVDTGIVEVFFGELVPAAGNEDEWWYQAAAVDAEGMIWKPALIVPGTAQYNAVAFTSIPLPVNILGLDAIRLPENGRVPMIRPGDFAVVHRGSTVIEVNPVAGAVVDLQLPQAKLVLVKDANGANVASDQFSIDATNGNLQWNTPLDLSAYTLPITINALVYYQSLVSDVQINGKITLSMAVPYALPADGQTFVSSKLVFDPQNLSARVTNVFSQETWLQVWAEAPQGNATAGQYDDINFPIQITNQGSQTERWRLEFVTATTVNVIGEKFGQVLTGVSITQAIAPINPATNTPYFTIPAGGWSAGWVVGNVLRLDTVAANFPVWVIRTVLPSEAIGTEDRFKVLLQGDAEGV